METTDIQARIDETKALIRRVRTPEGARRFGQPIGSIIVRDPIPSTRRRKRRKAAGRDDQSIDVSLVRNTPTERSVSRTDIDAARVAPPVALPETERTKIPNPGLYNDGTRRDYKTVQRFENEPPMAQKLDWDYLNTATAKQALQDLDEMGVQMKLSPMFAKDRDFMVSLAEVIRVHEEMFPGFVFRHGNVFAGSRKMGAGGALAYNRIFTRRDSEDAAIVSADSPEELPYVTMSGAGGGGVVAGRYYEIPSTDMNQTMTVFTSGLLNQGMGLRYEPPRTATGQHDLKFTASADWVEVATEKANSRVADMIYVMTHEFGHGINHTVSGNLSFEIDGWEDPDQYKRRWYAEYATNSMIDLFADLGVVQRGDSDYVADDIKAQAEHYKRVIKPRQKQVEAYEDFLLDLQDELADQDYDVEVAKAMAEGLDLPRYVHSLMQDRPNVPIWQLLRPTELSYLLSQKARNDEGPGPEVGYQESGRRAKALPPEMTFAMWEAQGYIKLGSFNKERWKRLVSEYGATKVVEFEAETWASYMLNAEVTEAALIWGNAVHDMYTWWVQDDMDAEFGKNNPKEGS